MWDFTAHARCTAVITEQGETIGYAGLRDAADVFSAQIPARCLVLCLCSNELGSLVGYVGCLRGRIVPFLGEASLDRQLLANLKATYRPDYVWCPSGMVPEFGDARVVYSAHGYVLLKTTHELISPLHDDLALLLSTSGSTGSPKFVRVSYRNLESNAAAIAEYLRLDGSERAITTLPMSYSYGLSIINSHLAVGATIILNAKTLMQREFWQQFRDRQATSFGGVPYTYEMLDKLRFFQMELRSLRTMTQAGGRLTPELQRKFAEYGEQKQVAFFVMYGQTEATARISYLPAADAVRRCGSIGRAIPRGRLYLVGDDGRQIERANTVGELVYEGENVAFGYAEDRADLAKGDEWHGVLRTGDLARFDEERFFYVVGRTKRFLKIFGNRVNLDEVEDMLHRAFPSLDCACGGRDDQLCVYAVKPFAAAAVSTFVAGKLGIHFSGVESRAVERIPRTTAGKILYDELPRFAW